MVYNSDHDAPAQGIAEVCLTKALPSVLDGPVVVVGGGVTGLVTAHLLAEAGATVHVIEKLPELGGLARSFHYDGFAFDVGPHRFHTGNPYVSGYLDRVLKRDGTFFPRVSEVYFEGEYYRWPFRPQGLVKLPPSLAMKSFADLMVNGMREYGQDSFEDYVLRQYGPTLYKHFFAGYSEKFLGIHPRETHQDWATAGINRAIIDDKLQMQNLSQLVKSTFTQFNKTEQSFLYPRGGMHHIWNLVEQEIVQNGGSVYTGTSAKLEAEDGRITAVWAGDKRIECGRVIWTAPLTVALNQLGLPSDGLGFRTLLLYNVMIEGDVPREYQWCYYGAHDIVFNRISIPRYFCPETCPPGTTGLCAEVTCLEGDDRWDHAEKLTDWVVDDLIRVKLIPNRRVVHDVRVERIPDGYPIYYLNYPAALERAQKGLGQYANFTLCGRSGTYWYNNMDHCMEAAMALVKRLLQEAGVNEATDDNIAHGSLSA